jgi:hypothetical protein
MKNRIVAFMGASALAAAGLWLPTSLSAQSPVSRAATAARPAPGKYSPPRLADGHPDLQGVFDVATITPIERPQNVTSLTISDEEAVKAEKYLAERRAKENAASDPNRAAPKVGGDSTIGQSQLEFLERAGGGAVGGYNTFWLASGNRVVEIDGQKRSSIVVDPANGRVPAMKPEAAARNRALRAITVNPDAAEGTVAGPAGQYDGPELRPLSERCVLGFGSTSGPPTLPNYFYNNLKQIVQTPTSILILNEMVHDARIIRMNAPHMPSNIRRWMGDSVGHWEGDTLVVDTTNFTNKTQFNGSAENLHVIERFTRVDKDTILYRFTIDDPTTWDRTWSGEYPWIASNEPLYEYACHEGNYALGDVLRGARLEEKERAQKQAAPAAAPAAAPRQQQR